MLSLGLTLVLATSTPLQCPGGICPLPAAPWGLQSLPPVFVVPLPLRQPQPQPLPALRRPAPASAPRGECVGGCPCECGDRCQCLEGKLCTDASCRCKVHQQGPGTAGNGRPGRNFGLEVDHIAKGNGPRYWRNGVEVSREQAIRAIEASAPGRIPDDGSMPLLTFIGGSKANRDKACNDFKEHPALASHRGSWREQCYEADHPLLRLRGFVTRGKTADSVVVYAQLPGGKVLYHALEYPGPEALKSALDVALGRSPLPQPAPAPAPAPAPLPTPVPFPAPTEPTNVPLWVWVVGALLAFLALRRKD